MERENIRVINRTNFDLNWGTPYPISTRFAGNRFCLSSKAFLSRSGSFFQNNWEDIFNASKKTDNHLKNNVIINCSSKLQTPKN